MTPKKYLSLEEAAAMLGVRTDEVIRLREKGELRGFADRGTWKFKSDDVEECQRRRQPDSNPDVPLMSEDDKIVSGPASDSDVRLMVSDGTRKQLTGSSAELPIMKPGSDSDVRLVGSSSQAKSKKGSDSDVKLILPKESDSDVKLSDSDSDVRLASKPPPAKLSDSDSDVRLAAAPRSDSDVRLAKPPGSDSDVRLSPPPGSDSDVTLLQSTRSGVRRGGTSPLPLDARGSRGGSRRLAVDG